MAFLDCLVRNSAIRYNPLGFWCASDLHVGAYDHKLFENVMVFTERRTRVGDVEVSQPFWLILIRMKYVWVLFVLFLIFFDDLGQVLLSKQVLIELYMVKWLYVQVSFLQHLWILVCLLNSLVPFVFTEHSFVEFHVVYWLSNPFRWQWVLRLHNFDLFQLLECWFSFVLATFGAPLLSKDRFCQFRFSVFGTFLWDLFLEFSRN